MDQGRIQRHQFNKCYPVLKDNRKSINNVINIFFLKSRSYSKRREPIALNLCKSQGTQHRMAKSKGRASGTTGFC